MDGAAATPAARPAGGTAASRRTGHGAGSRILFSQVRNEAPFLVEWIAYHRVIGFDEVVICSNPSTDGTEEILAALAAAGEIRHLRAVPGPTDGALRIGSETFAREVGYAPGNWYLWLDADEFLNVHAGNRTVDALIAAMGERQIAPISWRVFGAGGNRTFPGRLISPAFTGAALPEFGSNLEVKTFFRFSAAIRGFGRYGINRPAIMPDAGLDHDAVMVGNGGPALPGVRANQRWLKGADFGKSAWVDPAEFGWTHAQLNHYVIRTPEHYALKRLRGRGYTANPDANGLQRYTDSFYRDHDRNEAEDRSILHWQDAVTREMARLTALPGVAAALERAQALVAGLLASLAAPAAPLAPEGPAAQAAFPLTLPPPEAACLREALARSPSLLEYGGGGSTVLAAGMGCRIVSVDSDKARAARLAAHLAGITDRAEVQHVDIGPTGDWGRPTGREGFARYHAYALSVWDRPDLDPDLVLIGGRFRAACLVAVRLRARRPTTVLFADYADRRSYHGVERLARKDEVIGRMARFTVTPGPIPPDMVTQAIGWFVDQR